MCIMYDSKVVKKLLDFVIYCDLLSKKKSFVYFNIKNVISCIYVKTLKQKIEKETHSLKNDMQKH